MTADAQHALRRTIEDYSKQTRFCIICNYITKYGRVVDARIIEPLASRCVKFRFREIPTAEQYVKLEKICQGEDIKYTPDSLTHLIGICEGDLRKSTNLLQTVSKVYKKLDSIQLINEIAGVSAFEL
jgi:replication factor C subunit 2/4